MKLECRDKLREQETKEDGKQHRSCNYTYGDLGERCFGRIGRHFTEATIILSQTGGTVAYLVFIGQNVSSVFATEDGHGPLSPAIVVLALLLPSRRRSRWCARCRRSGSSASSPTRAPCWPWPPW